MADPRFFEKSGPFPLAELAEVGGARLSDNADAQRVIHDVAPLETAGQRDLTFLDNRKYRATLAASAAAACVLKPELAEHAPQGMAVLLTDTPYKAYALIARALYPKPAPRPGIAASAVVDPRAKVSPSAEISAGAVIEAGAEIGERCRIGPNAVVGCGVVLGKDTEIGAGATLSHCLIGSRVRIYPGVRIGQDGFGFAIDPAGHVPVPQLGRVIIEDDVEIGANVTIDRGAGPDTVIGRGCMIDNLVQIGHNVEVGAGSVIVAQAGISGSTKLGKFVVLAGQAGLAGHLTIGDGARVGAQSGVMRDVPPGEDVVGSPAMPSRQYWRWYTKLMKLSGLRGG